MILPSFHESGTEGVWLICLDLATIMFVHCFLHECVVFGWIFWNSGVVLVVSFAVVSLLPFCQGHASFYFILLFLVVCIRYVSISSWHYVVQEIGCTGIFLVLGLSQCCRCPIPQKANTSALMSNNIFEAPSLTAEGTVWHAKRGHTLIKNTLN
jgi:hypothetical protein